MNKHLHRIVFNATRGLRMAVAEHVSSHGQPMTSTSGHAARRVCLAHLLAGGLSFGQAEVVLAEIMADPTAPKDQQPIILRAANGVLQVDIQTPSAGGVSRNTYSQFDVDRQGAILNNARTAAQTQLGGWVAGNPWLAAGSARIILNEVNSSDPSLLRGPVEVAGDRAQVVIANPAGVICDGCHFIHAHRATLTTGSAMMNGGHLEGFRVGRGHILVKGGGMLAKQADYADLIARSVELNAGIWAAELQVHIGPAQVSADLSRSTALPPDSQAPRFALDTSSLGGMYAEKIKLIGTEHGVGVRIAGEIGASVGDVVVRHDGRLENRGQVVAIRDVQITAPDLDNDSGGEIGAGATRLTIAGTLNNRGLIDGQQTSLAGGTLNNIGTGRVFGDHVAITADTVNNDAEIDAAAIIAARERMDLGVSTLNNREHAGIFSVGDMAVGGGLDADLQATGRAVTLNNRSARIESMGQMALASETINNTNEHFASEMQPEGGPRYFTEYQGAGSPRRYPSNDPATYVYNDESDHLMTPDGWYEQWTRYEYERNTTATTVTQTDPGVISAAGDMQITATTLVNDKSHILAGGTLTGKVQDLQNREATGQRIETDTGHATSYWRDHKKGRDGTGSDQAAYRPPPVITDISLSTVRFEQNVSHDPSARRMAAPDSDNVASLRSRVIENGLFRFNSNPDAKYLVEADPRFTHHKRWLSSDHQLQALSMDPALSQKRMGDGFYEQKRVREQVAQLTGRRFLDDYRNDEAQYRALLNQGVTIAKAWNLRPGIALSPSQMARLTSDIVWLVEQEVSLPDGSTTRALVPQVYLRPAPGDLNGKGALIEADRLELDLAGVLDNQGTIAGRRVVSLTAETVENSGGRLSGQDVSVEARTDVNSAGGTIDAANSLYVAAARDVNIASTTRSNHNAQGSISQVDRVAGLYVSNASVATLRLNAGRNLNLTAVEIGNSSREGSTRLEAGNDLNLDTVKTGSQQTLVWNGKNHRQSESSQERGSRLQTQGNITLLAGRDVNARAASVTSDQGELIVQAANDINIMAGRSRETVDEVHQHSGTSGVLSKSTISTRDFLDQTLALGSTLSADHGQLVAGHDMKITGSNVVSTHSTQLRAEGKVTLGADVLSTIEQYVKSEATSGVFGTGGVGLTFGSQQQTVDQHRVSGTAFASTVGSTQGDVSIHSGQRYSQIGSHVVAPKGKIDITASKVDITEAREAGSNTTTNRFQQGGLSVGVTSPILSALQTARQMKQFKGQTSDSRMQVLAGATTVLAAKNAYDAFSSNPGAAGGINLNISMGTSENLRQTTQQHDHAASAQIIAGGDAVISATGAGPDSDLLVRGSTIKAGGNIDLQADNTVRLQAARNTDEQNSTGKGHSASLGASFGTDGLLFTASLSGSRGKADGADVTWTHTHIDAGKRLTLQSGGDTTLQGAVAGGKQVVADIGGNLNMESLQDTSRFASTQKSIGGSLSVGYGKIGGSFHLSQSKINSDYVSVTERSGIQAGDLGFQVAVQGDTALKGAAIASTEAAVQAGLNRFRTEGTLSLSDIQNRADYSGSGVAVSLSGASDDKDSRFAPPGAGKGSDSGHASSITTSGISGIAGNRDVRTGDAPTGIGKIFDADKVLKEINAQVQITQAMSQQAGQAVDHYVQKNRTALREQLKNAENDEQRTELQKKLNELANQERVMNILIGAVTGQGSAAITKEGLSAAADYMRKEMLADSAKFPGVTDGTVVYSNLSADSVGVRGDGMKLGGTRWDLDQLCGSDNRRCQRSPNGLLELDAQGRVQFDPKKADVDGLKEFLLTKDGKKLFGATGGIQGVAGTFFGGAYMPGGLRDRVIESFAGTHDMIGGRFSGLYDEQGNATRGRPSSVQTAQDIWSASGAIVVSSPFAMAELLPPQVWNAISILLKAVR
jgi:filamentous hemagglutinin